MNVSFLPLALASQKERRQKFIILHVWNIIFRDFLFFSFHFLCWMQKAKSMQNVHALKGMF